MATDAYGMHDRSAHVHAQAVTAARGTVLVRAKRASADDDAQIEQMKQAAGKGDLWEGGAAGTVVAVSAGQPGGRAAVAAVAGFVSVRPPRAALAQTLAHVSPRAPPLLHACCVQVAAVAAFVAYVLTMGSLMQPFVENTISAFPTEPSPRA